MRQIDHFIVGGAPAATRFADVMDPNNGGVQAQVALGDQAVLDQAVAAAQAAQPAWAAMNPQRRSRVMFNYVHSETTDRAAFDRGIVNIFESRVQISF